MIKTADNQKGLFSCETFRDDDDRLILATISEKSLTSVQIKDYTSYADYEITNIFGEANDNAA